MVMKIRASSLPDLLDCAARWEAKYIKKLRLPTSGKAQLGTAVHAGTAVFDSSILARNPITVDDAAGEVVDAIWKPREEVAWGDDLGQREAEVIALDLHRKYCRNVAPRQEYVAVEQTCDALEIKDLGITLTGTTDRVRKTPDGLGIVDLKTGGAAVAADGTVKTARHAAQIAVYELLAGFSLGSPITASAQIVGLQVAKTEKARRVGVGEIVNAREALVGDGFNPGILEMVAKMLKAGIFLPNPLSPICTKKYCPMYLSCRYRG